MKTSLKPYRGPRRPEEVVDGINAAIRNARRLVNDAKTLLDLSRFPTAASLAILSIEESEKVTILRGIARAPDEKICQTLWNDYTNHRRKNASWIIPDLWENGARDIDSLLPVYEPKANHTALLEQVKQSGLYTDYRGKSGWSEPGKEIDEETARRLVNSAILLQHRNFITLKEIELWIEHMKPVYHEPFEVQKIALLNFNRALKKEGLHVHLEGGISVEDFLNISQ